MGESGQTSHRFDWRPVAVMPAEIAKHDGRMIESVRDAAERVRAWVTWQRPQGAPERLPVLEITVEAEPLECDCLMGEWEPCADCDGDGCDTCDLTGEVSVDGREPGEADAECERCAGSGREYVAPRLATLEEISTAAHALGAGGWAFQLIVTPVAEPKLERGKPTLVGLAPAGRLSHGDDAHVRLHLPKH